MRATTLCALGLAALLGAGCSSSFAPATYLVGLRVLGVVAEPPEITNGQSTTLSAVLSAASAGATLSWSRCTLVAPPGTGGIDPRCASQETASFLVPLGEGPSLSFTMPPDVGPTTLGIPDYTTGLYVPIRLVATLGSERIVSFYGMRYHVSVGLQPPNQNPRLESLSLVEGGADAGPETVTLLPEGSVTRVAAGAKVKLRAVPSAESVESYVTVTDFITRETAPITESLRALWYSEAGEFTNTATGVAKPDTELDLAKRPPATLPADVRVYVVLRDERGGTAVTERMLRVE